MDADRLGWWLCERQLPAGGLNGRPEKLPDVCYSWWVLSSLTILGRLHWINKDKLVIFFKLQFFFEVNCFLMKIKVKKRLDFDIDFVSDFS